MSRRRTRKTVPVLIGLVAAVAAVLAWANWPGPAELPMGTVADAIVVRKGARTLEVMRGGTVLRSYRVSLGRNPVGPKEREGDGRTPEGQYVLDYRNPSSAFHLALHVSYPAPAGRF